MPSAAILAALAQIAGFLRALLLPLTYVIGRMQGKSAAQAEQDAENSKLNERYAEIATKGIDDNDIDKRLEDGTL